MSQKGYCATTVTGAIYGVWRTLAEGQLCGDSRDSFESLRVWGQLEQPLGDKGKVVATSSADSRVDSNATAPDSGVAGVASFEGIPEKEHGGSGVFVPFSRPTRTEGLQMSQEPEAFKRSLDKLPRNNAKRLIRFIDAMEPDVSEDAVRAVISLRSGLQMTHVVNPFSPKVQALLDWLVGQAFGSVEANKAVTRCLQSMLTRYGLRPGCPKKGCGKLAYIRCGPSGRAKHGVFRFEHQEDGRQVTHAASASFPAVKIFFSPFCMAKPGRPVS